MQIEAIAMTDAELIAKCAAAFEYRPDGQLIRRSGKGGGKPAGWTTNQGYRITKVKDKCYLVHRLIFLIHNGWMPKEIDHINRDKSDNRIENLRAVTRAENQWNVKDRGCHYVSRDKLWIARITENGARRTLGYFKSEAPAMAAYAKAKEERDAKIGC